MDGSLQKTSGKQSQDSRQKVIDAAIFCISTLGFHKATTTRIAEEAGISWGVIQYHFNDKEGILSAVLESIFPAYSESFRSVTQRVGGGSLYQRVYRLIEVLWQELNSHNYRASIEILQNVRRDPGSQIDCQKYLQWWSDGIGKAWDSLFPEFAYNQTRSQQVKRIFFASLRGLAETQSMADKTPVPTAEFQLLTNLICFALCSTPEI